MLKEDIRDRLLKIANEARKHAYAPYSKDFKVGAAVLTEDGSIFPGCNVENSSFGATMCAERVAVFKAVCEGHRKIRAIAVIADDSQPIAPCGMCLQVISEFGQDADIIMANTKGDVELTNMKVLLPRNFKFGNLNR
jgi:cytidine deaminase